MTTKRCAFLTLRDTAGWVMDDDLAHGPLRALGWTVESVPWRDFAGSWDAFDAVVIRSPWDYHTDVAGFTAVLRRIERSEAPLFNGLDLVRWNLDKRYLRDLSSREGVSTIPTLWRDRLRPGDLDGIFEALGSDEIVVKPVVGLNAIGAFRIRRSERHAAEGEVEEVGQVREVGEVEDYFSDRALMAQPFARPILEEGEYSLIFFDGAFSHAILKTPTRGDFRVQEEHGGRIRAVEPGDDLRATAEAALEALGERPLYARIDLVRSNDGKAFWLMEMELIEPSLYFRTDPEAPARFATALDRRVARRS